MRGVIFGSGLIGLIAKHMLSGNWEVVPFGRSRFYSFNPPLADNFIIRDAETDDFMRDMGGDISSVFYRYAFSINGQLMFEYDRALSEAWLQKMFLGTFPSQAAAYWTRRMAMPVYNLRANKIYATLLNKHLNYLKQESRKGDVTEIGDHYFVRNGVKIEFDCAVSTIPLTVLYKLVGFDASQLKTATEYYYHIESGNVDLEGANQVLVVDYPIDFYRVTNISPRRYLFYSTRDIKMPGPYFLQMIGFADLIDGTAIKDAIPLGEIPDLSPLEKMGIFCVGSCAQHDWCMEVGSCIKRLVKYSRRGYQSDKPKTFGNL